MNVIESNHFFKSTNIECTILYEFNVYVLMYF